ncbi:hypothetical protein COBT_002452 [Conglomerata obtusa]
MSLQNPTENDKNITFETFLNFADDVSKKNKDILKNKIKIHTHDQSLIIIYDDIQSHEVFDKLKTSINQIILYFVKEYFKIYNEADFFIGMSRYVLINQQDDVNSFLLDSFRSFCKLYISACKRNVNTCFAVSESIISMFCITSVCVNMQIDKFFVSGNRILYIDNFCKDSYDFELAYNVINKSANLKNISKNSNIIIINLKHTDKNRRDDYYNNIYEHARGFDIPKECLNDSKCEFLNYEWLANFKKDQLMSTYIGKYIIFHANGQKHEHNSLLLQGMPIYPNGNVVFLNTAVKITYNEIQQDANNIDSKKCKQIAYTPQNRKFSIYIYSHSPSICYSFSLTRIRANKFFARWMGITNFCITICVKIIINRINVYVYDFSYYDSDKTIGNLCLQASKNLFEKKDRLQRLGIKQIKANKIFCCFKNHLEMNIMQYNDHFKSSDVMIYDLLHLIFIKRPWSQEIELAEIKNYYHAISWLSKKLYKHHKNKVNLTYATGYLDISKLCELDILLVNNHFEFFNLDKVYTELPNKNMLNNVNSLIMYIEFDAEQEKQRYYIGFMLEDQINLKHLYFHNVKYKNFKCEKRGLTAVLKSKNYELILDIIIYYFKSWLITYTLDSQQCDNNVINQMFLDYSIIWVCLHNNHNMPGIDMHRMFSSKRNLLNSAQRFILNEISPLDLLLKYKINDKFFNFKSEVQNALETYLKGYNQAYNQDSKLMQKSFVFFQNGDIYPHDNISFDIISDLKTYQ